MKRLAVCIYLAIVCLRATAQVQGSGLMPRDLAGAESYVEQAKTRLERAEQAYKMASETYKAGTTGALDLQNAQSELKLSQIVFRESSRNLRLVRRIDRLTQRVNVDLKEATVEQAAQALSQVSQIPIRVDKSVTTNKRLSAKASDARTGDLLQTIAKQLHLQIAPDEETGIVLKTWPKLAVNGVEREYIDAYAPWSDAWGADGFTNPAFLSNYTAGTLAGGLAATGRSPGNLNSGLMSSQFFGAGIAPGSVTMTSVGNQVVVAEPGRGPRGELGTWLTVYDLRGSQLIRQSTIFHKRSAGR